jgi:hypothetical protein
MNRGMNRKMWRLCRRTPPNPQPPTPNPHLVRDCVASVCRVTCQVVTSFRPYPMHSPHGGGTTPSQRVTWLTSPPAVICNH